MLNALLFHIVLVAVGLVAVAKVVVSLINAVLQKRRRLIGHVTSRDHVISGLCGIIGECLLS